MRRTVLLVAVATLGLAMLESAASATTTRIPSSGSEICVLAQAGRMWTADGVVHVRGMIYECVMTADVGTDPYSEGTETVVINYNLNTATGSGALWGTFHSVLAAFAGDGGGGFDGTWNGTFVSGAWTGKLVGKGYGALDGWQVRFNLLPTGLMTDNYSGFVFEPGV